jgi:succinate-acetate transporter protein
MRDNQSDKIKKKKLNPENIALFGAAATGLTIINMSTGIEPPSQWVIILQYAALAGGLIALVVGLIMMAMAPK